MSSDSAIKSQTGSQIDPGWRKLVVNRLARLNLFSLSSFSLTNESQTGVILDCENGFAATANCRRNRSDLVRARARQIQP